MKKNKQYWEDIKEVMNKAQCVERIANEALRRADGNIKDAIKIANDLKSNELYVGGGSSGLAVEGYDENLLDRVKKLFLYKNGLKVDDKFFDFNEHGNDRLKEMLKKGEFDAEILGGKPGEDVKVAFVDLSEKEYVDEKEDQPKNKKMAGIGHKISDKIVIEDFNVPDNIDLDEKGDVMFKILFPNKKTKILVKSGRKISDILKFLEKNYAKSNKIFLTSNNIKVNENDDVSVLKNTLVVLKYD